MNETPLTSRVHVYIDESMMEASGMVLVGAAVVTDQDRMNRIVEDGYRRALAIPDYWERHPEKRTIFAQRGFHHVEDAPDLRDYFRRELMARVPFRAHIAHSQRVLPVSDQDLMINMYYSLVRNLCVRYRNSAVTIVFEEATQDWNGLFGKIVEQVKADLNHRGIRNPVDAYLGRKPNHGIALVDYALAIVGQALQPKAPQWQTSQARLIGSRLAHVVDFDHAVHRSARGGIQLF